MNITGVSDSAFAEGVTCTSRTEFALWHALTIVAGVTLAASFVLPAFDIGCGRPAHLLRVGLYDWWLLPNMPAAPLFFLFSCFAACHLLGALMAVGSAAQLAGCMRLIRVLSTVPPMLLVLVGAGLLWTAPATHGEDFLAGEPWPLPSTLVAGLATLAYVIWASRLGSRAARCCEFGACVAAVTYLSFLSLSGVVAYGTYIALTAGVLLLVGTVGTARLVAHQSWWSTLGQLLTCRLKDINGEPAEIPERSPPEPISDGTHPAVAFERISGSGSCRARNRGTTTQ